MSDARHEDSQHRRPHPQPMAAPFLEFDLTRELDQLHCEPQPTSGQNAKTLVKYDDFCIVLIALKAHTRIPGHQAEDESPSTQRISPHHRMAWQRREPPRWWQPRHFEDEDH